MSTLDILKYIWQLPQNLVGLIIGLIAGFNYNPRGFYEWNLYSGISLGMYIFLNRYTNDASVDHEKGHQIQSLYLGPFYLLVIGLPSITWASLRRLGLFTKYSYYSFYTEKWADKLGGVNRYES